MGPPNSHPKGPEDVSKSSHILRGPANQLAALHHESCKPIQNAERVLHATDEPSQTTNNKGVKVLQFAISKIIKHLRGPP